MPEKKEDVIELYELWNRIKARFGIIAPQPKHFNLRKEVIPVTSIDGIALEVLDYSDDTAVAASGEYTITIQPPKGTIYQLMDWYFYAPDPAGGGASTAGSHALSIYTANTLASNSRKAFCSRNFGGYVRVGQYYEFTGDTENPAAASQQIALLMGGLFASYDAPVVLVYTNDTDKIQAATRFCIITAKVLNERVSK